MIKTKEELKRCLEIEKKIYYPHGEMVLPFAIREKDILYRYTYYLRKTEYHINSQHEIRKNVYKVILLRMQNKYAIHIPPNVCDVGVSISHVGPILIHNQCKIGKNLRVHVGVNIGANGGKPPCLGDNVYIGPGAKLFGDINIASGCKIGANAVVNKSCNKYNTTLVGVPAVEIQKEKEA